MIEAGPVFYIPDTVKIVFYVQDGVQCWTLDTDEITTFDRRGWPYRVVEYAQNKP